MQSKRSKLRSLLIVLGIVGTIQLYGLTGDVSLPPDSLICLKPHEFDFYAQAVVDCKELRRDSTILEVIIRSKDKIIERKDKEIQNCEIALVAKDSIGSKYKKAFISEQVLKNKMEKRSKIFKNLSLVFASSTVILIMILLLIV